MKKSGATFNTLMKHMRAAGIVIEGSTHKRQLILSGYFHGYKGYRYCRNPQDLIPYSSFSELQAVIDFDEEIKANLYRPIMQLETALKSITTDIVVKEAKSDSLSVIMEILMNTNGHKKVKAFRDSKHQLRDDIHSSLTRAYTSKKGNIVAHYYNKDAYAPIWAIFEVITLGQFGHFVELLDSSIKLKISKAIGIPIKFNTDGSLLPAMIYVLQDLRNAIAHNNAVFDARYRGNRKIGSAMIECLRQATKIQDITFDSIFDDIVLVFYLLKSMGFRKIPAYSLIKRLISTTEEIYHNLKASLYMKILPNGALKKLQAIEKFIRAA